VLAPELLAPVCSTGADAAADAVTKALKSMKQPSMKKKVTRAPQTDEVKGLKERIAAMKPSPERKQLRQQLKKLMSGGSAAGEAETTMTDEVEDVASLKAKMADLEPGPERRKLRQQLQKLTGTPLEKTAQTDEDAPSEPSEFSSDIHLDAALVVVPIQAEYLKLVEAVETAERGPAKKAAREHLKQRKKETFVEAKARIHSARDALKSAEPAQVENAKRDVKVASCILKMLKQMESSH